MHLVNQRSADELRRTIDIALPTITEIRIPSYDREQNLLHAHLQAMLGAWPPRSELDLHVWAGRDHPGWDGKTSPGLGMESPAGTLLSLSPTLAEPGAEFPLEQIRQALQAPDAVTAVPAAFGRPDLIFGRAVFRWTDRVSDLPEIGTWLDSADSRLPAWVRLFNGGVLAALNGDGAIMAAVGIKRHNRFGREIAVETEPAYRGRGLASMLVTQAARQILRDGALPLYLHELDNLASARAAERSGFFDRGWRMIGLYAADRQVSKS